MGSTEDEAAQELARLRERVRVISEVTRRFAEATTDYQRLLDSVAHSLTETIQDACTVFLLDEDGQTLTPCSMHAVVPAALALVRERFAGHKLELAQHPELRYVLSSGQSILVPRLAARPQASVEQARWEKALGLHSVIVVPMQVQGRSIGLVTLTRFQSSSPAYEQQDLELVQNLAAHAGLAIENAKLYVAAEQARQSLQRSEAAQRQFFESSPMASFVVDVDTQHIVAANIAALVTYGYSREEFLGLALDDLRAPGDEQALSAAFRAAGDMDMHSSARHRRKDGSLIQVEGSSHVGSFEGRRARFVMLSDQTQRLRAEAELRQSQKMEAVGRLAGGIAHDFNNVLSIVLGYSEEILSQSKPTGPIHDGLQEIQAAANRAAELTRQLLMFSRQQVLEPKVLDLNEVLGGIERMLARVLGEQLQLVVVRDPQLGRIFADRGNIEQVIMNLAVNARDAMPGGGRLTIETANVMLDEAFVREHLGTQAGEYVFLGVTDTGAGMDQPTRARIFEPFFTTKELGKGTGLGLSTVLGIVQQSGGAIYVYSEVGHGTSFKVYLPRVRAEAERPAATQQPKMLRGSETVLLVEDEPAVRVVAKKILERLGYAVLPAATVAEAAAICDGHADNIHLLLTDVVMPGKNGVALAAELSARRPDMKVLYMSGYTDNSIGSHGQLDSGAAFLQKPFTAELLARKLRAVLDGTEA
jgi:two-component system, cell cycle sensor histidine kinase and response regulator CckA